MDQSHLMDISDDLLKMEEDGANGCPLHQWDILSKALKERVMG